jgi:manganese/zinc/iron transport system permease protein
MSALLLMNLALLGILYKELKVTTFDPGMAAMLGFAPALVHYVLMLALSVTTVGAFTAVGAILVVALVIVPAATARLLTDRLPAMIGLSVLIGAASAWTGFELALWLDTSVSGAMVTMLGAFFGLALLLSPSHGLVARALRHRANARRFAVDLLVAHLAHHEGAEHTVGNAGAALRWTPDHAARVIARAVAGGVIATRDGHLALTDTGRERAASLA